MGDFLRNRAAFYRQILFRDRKYNTFSFIHHASLLLMAIVYLLSNVLAVVNPTKIRKQTFSHFPPNTYHCNPSIESEIKALQNGTLLLN